jgi:hypothetical protein
MAKTTYRLSDLIEIHVLMYELMDPEQEADALTTGEGYSWEIRECVQKELRDRRLHPVQILCDPSLPSPEQSRLAPRAFAAGSTVDFCYRIEEAKIFQGKLYCTAASVKDYGRLSSQ